MKKRLGLVGAVAAASLSLTALASWHSEPSVTASSHREAPLIAVDPEADGTDFYMFRSPDNPDTVTFIMAYNPLESPEGGPNFYKFGDEVVYRLNVDNNADAEEDIVYEWRFKSEYRNKDTFLYNTGPVNSLNDPNLNFRQTYTMTRRDGNGEPRVLIENAPVAPVNVGKRSFPDYGKVMREAVLDVPNVPGAKVYAGPADDPFWVDLRIFDLLQVLPAGQAHDSLAGYNVHVIALQAPLTRFTANREAPSGVSDPNAVIAAWMTAHRPSMKIFQGEAGVRHEGDLVQVSRLGHALVNEVVVPVGFKDLWNGSHPRDDGRFLPKVVEPELATLMNAVLNFPAPTTGRDDLVSVFLTGVDGLTKPNRPNAKPYEALRLNLAVPPSADPKRLGVLAQDLAGYPNGRRLSDEATDISLAAVGGVLKGVEGAAGLSQGVPFNDVPFQSAFPFVAPAHPGNR